MPKYYNIIYCKQDTTYILYTKRVWQSLIYKSFSSVNNTQTLRVFASLRELFIDLYSTLAKEKFEMIFHGWCKYIFCMIRIYAHKQS